MVKQAIPINIPNTLSIVRILLTPLFAICLIKQFLEGALLVFAVAAVTDGLDGLVARVFRQKTTLGAYLDPIADNLVPIFQGGNPADIDPQRRVKLQRPPSGGGLG